MLRHYGLIGLLLLALITIGCSGNSNKGATQASEEQQRVYKSEEQRVNDEELKHQKESQLRR